MVQHSSITRPEPRSVPEARLAVEMSRARMVDTLDTIEQRIISKKQEIGDRLDVLRPVREQVRARPWSTLAIAVGVGAVTGLLNVFLRRRS